MEKRYPISNLFANVQDIPNASACVGRGKQSKERTSGSNIHVEIKVAVVEIDIVKGGGQVAHIECRDHVRMSFTTLEYDLAPLDHQGRRYNLLHRQGV